MLNVEFWMVDWGEEKPNGEFWMMDWRRCRFGG
jgi:hypothetical protein